MTVDARRLEVSDDVGFITLMPEQIWKSKSDLVATVPAWICPPSGEISTRNDVEKLKATNQ